MRFHKRLRHRPLLQALAWFPPSLRYISQICRHTLHIHIYSYISVEMYIYPIRYMYIKTAGLIYSTICQSDMSPNPAPAVCPPPPPLCKKRNVIY